MNQTESDCPIQTINYSTESGRQNEGTILFHEKLKDLGTGRQVVLSFEEFLSKFTELTVALELTEDFKFSWMQKKLVGQAPGIVVMAQKCINYLE